MIKFDHVDDDNDDEILFKVNASKSKNLVKELAL